MEKLIKILREEAEYQVDLAMADCSREATLERRILWGLNSMLSRIAIAIEKNGGNSMLSNDAQTLKDIYQRNPRLIYEVFNLERLIEMRDKMQEKVKVGENVFVRDKTGGGG